MTFGSSLTALGFLVGIVVYYIASKERKMDTEGTGYLALCGLLGGVIGAKLGQWSVDAAPVMVMLDPRSGGRTILGGVLGGWLAVELAKKFLGIRRSTGDLFALALAAGEAVGRLGCHFNQCCFGAPTTGFFAVYQNEAWRHPTQLLSSAVALVLFTILWTVRNRMPREGQLFCLYLFGWATARFFLEFLRTNDRLIFGLTLAQISCLGILALAMVFWRSWKTTKS